MIRCADLYERSFPAEPHGVKKIRDEIGEVARAAGLAPEQVFSVMLAVSEAVTNVIVHAYRCGEGTVRVSATRAADELAVVVADDGSGHRPRLDSPGAGLGTPIIATMARRLEIVATPAGTEVHMAFEAPRAA